MKKTGIKLFFEFKFLKKPELGIINRRIKCRHNVSLNSKEREVLKDDEAQNQTHKDS